MTRRQVNLILGIVGLTVVLCAVMLAAGAWFIMSILDHQPADEIGAVAVFDATRAQFTGLPPY